jgi:hypothetical protein
MIVEFKENITGIPVYLNPRHVISLRPDPENPLEVTQVKLEDGETLRVVGVHTAVAAKLRTAPS